MTWASALTVAGAAATLTLLPRLIKLPPDSAWIPRVAPLAAVIVLVVVLPTVWRVGESIAASKRDRVSEMIEQLREWTAQVKAVASRDWSGGGWDDAGRAVEALGQIQLTGRLDASLWREAFSMGRDVELAEETLHLVDATVEGFDKSRVPRVSRLRDPAFYTTATGWEESSAFPKASATVGRYYQELGRIFQGLEIQETFSESTALTELKKSYLERRSKLESILRPQMEDDWTDHWAIFRIPGKERLVGYSEMPLGKLLKSSLPVLGTSAADLPGLLDLSYESVRSLERIPGCRHLPPYNETKNGNEYQYSRLDCYSYAPHAEDLGADPRVEMRLVYKSAPNRYLLSDQKPTEIYFLFPLPAGQEEKEFQKQVMSDLAEAVGEKTQRDVAPINRSNSVERGFRVRGDGRTVTVYEPRFIPLYENRRALQVRAERQT
jgi:hypothetical protein